MEVVVLVVGERRPTLAGRLICISPLTRPDSGERFAWSQRREEPRSSENAYRATDLKTIGHSRDAGLARKFKAILFRESRKYFSLDFLFVRTFPELSGDFLGASFSAETRSKLKTRKGKHFDSFHFTGVKLTSLYYIVF